MKTLKQFQKSFMELHDNLMKQMNEDQKDFMQENFRGVNNVKDLRMRLDYSDEWMNASFDAGYADALEDVKNILFSNNN